MPRALCDSLLSWLRGLRRLLPCSVETGRFGINTMIDRRARDILGNALSGFMQGRILSDAFAETVVAYAWCDKTEDSSVMAIAEVLDSLYSDFRNEPIHVTEEVWRILLRTLAFLRTDLAYSFKEKDSARKCLANGMHWPFADEQEWRNHEHLQPTCLPEYDPTQFPCKRKSTSRALAEVFGILLVAIGVLIAVFVILTHLFPN